MFTRGVKQTKNRGATLIFIVLVGFIMLSILSALIISIAARTIKLETWQKEYAVKYRLEHLARSAADATVEAIIATSADFGTTSELISGVSSDKTTVIEDSDSGITNQVQLLIMGNPASKLTVTATAYEGDKHAAVKADILMSTAPKTVTWRIKR